MATNVAVSVSSFMIMSLSLELLTEECRSASGCTSCSLSKWPTASDVVEMHLAKRVMAVRVLLAPSPATAPYVGRMLCSYPVIHGYLQILTTAAVVKDGERVETGAVLLNSSFGLKL